MDYKDYVDIDEDSPPVEAKTSSSPYSGYVDIDSLEEAKPAEKSSGMGYLDPLKSVAAGAAGDAAAGFTGAQVAAEKAGFPTVARVAQAGSMGLHRAEEAINESITPEGRAAQGAALLPDEGQEQLGSHPIREATMKGSGIAAPAAVGFAGGVLGGMLAGPAGIAAGTAGAGAFYGLAKGVDQAVAWTNDLGDEDLAKEAPVFGKFKEMYLEENLGKGMDQRAAEKQASYDARVAFHDGLYGIKQAAFDAGTNALAFGAGRKVITGLGGGKLIDYALSGGALGAVSAAGDVNQQNVEIAKKGEGDVDLFKTAKAFLNGTAEGLAFHGAGEGTKKLATWLGGKQSPEDWMRDREQERNQAAEKDVVNTPDTAAPATGEVPKGMRTGEAPPPNEAAQEGQIGNTVNPPTRDQEPPAAAKAKGTSKGRSKKKAVEGSVTVLDDSAPPPAETEALAQSTPGDPTKVTLAEPKTPVRMYHGTNEDGPSLSGGERWVTPDPEYARNFGMGSKNVYYVDVPYGSPEEIGARNWDELDAGTNVVGTYRHTKLPESYTGQFKKLEPAEAVRPEPNPQVFAPRPEVPEAAPTIEAQVNAFFDNKRDVLRFENADQVPADRPKGVREHKGSDGTIWWHRPRKVPQGKIEQAIKGKTENELLGLGPYSKEAVEADVAAGGQELAAVARDENGVETAAAATTDRLAADTVAAVQEANPEARVTLEQPGEVIEGRLNGTGKVIPFKLRPDKQDNLPEMFVPESLRKLPAEYEEAARNASDDDLRAYVERENAQLMDLRKTTPEHLDLPPYSDQSLAMRKELGRREQKRIDEGDAGRGSGKGKAKAEEIKAKQPEKEAPSPARKPRILEAQLTPEELARIDEAKRKLAAQRAEEEKRAAQIERRFEEKPEVVQGERKSKDGARNRVAAENAAKAEKVFAEHLPGEVEAGLASEDGKLRVAAKQAMLERARRVVDAATAAGYEIPGSIRNHTAAEAFVYNANALLKKYGNSKAFGRVADGPFIEFEKSERLQRAGGEAFKVDLQDRRAKGDEKFQKKTSAFERETVDEVGATNGVKIDARTEQRVVRTKTGETLKVEGAQAASEVRRPQLSEEEKRALAEKYSPKPAEKAEPAKPEVRSFNEDELLAGMDPVEGRTGGEREGHVSLDYGRDAPSIKIMRTARAADLMRSLGPPPGYLAGRMFPIIRQRLIHIAGDVQVHFVDRAELERLDGKGSLGVYKPRWGGEGGYVIMAHDVPADRQTHIYTHELLHAATEDALLRSPEIKASIKSIMNEAAEALVGKDPELLQKYGFKNESEFIAEAFSNPEFQRLLSKVQVSDKLARELGLEKRSLWSALVDRVREVLRMPPGAYSALEALIRPTNEAMTRQGRLLGREGARPEARSFISRDEARQMLDRFDATNLKDLYGRFKRGASSNTMLAMMGQRLGPKFGYFARKAVDLQQQMAVRTDNILRRKGGGLELVREGDKLRADPKTAADMDKAFDLGFKAREYNLDMTPGAKNEHIFGAGAKSDILNATQAKAAYADLRRQIDSLPPPVKAWLEKAATFFREEDNNRRQAVIRRVLDATDVDRELASAVASGKIAKADGTIDALAKRIFDDKMTPEDEALFKTNTIVKHLNEVANLKRLKGWYFPQEREGDYVLSARRDFTTPTGSNVYRVKNDKGEATNSVVFADPSGKRREAPARRAAQQWMRQLIKDDLLAKAEKVYVLESDPSKIIPNAEANAVGAPKTFKAYKVEVMDEFFDLFKDPASRNARAKELEAQGWGKIVQSVRQQNPNARWDGLVPSQVETMINSLQRRDKFAKLSQGAQTELIQSLRQATVRLLPGSRIQHHNLQSRNVAGYSKDMINVLAKSAQESARFQARTEFQPQINDVLTSMKGEVDLDKYSKRTEERQQVLRDLETRLTMEHGVSHEGFINKALDTLNKVSLIDKLFGPSFHFINAQEPWTTAAPVMGGRHGFVRTVKTMKDAYNMIGARRNALMPGLRDTGKAIGGENTNFTDYRANFKAEIAKNISGDRGRRLAAVLDYLHDRNLFGHEAGMEVARLAEINGTKFEKALDRIDLVSRQVGQAIEAINRSVTALSAYELEFARNKGNHEAALRYAHDVVHDTMGNYSASNSAPVFNHALGRAMLQFKKFAQKTYFLLGKTFGQAYAGDKEAQKAFLGVMFTHGVVAGALGLPIEPIKMAVITSNAIGVSPYSWDEIEDAIREEAAALLGKQGGMALTRGVPRAFLGYDASNRQGMADLLTGLGPRSSKPGDVKGWLFDEIAGPAIGMPIKWLEAGQNVAGALHKGDYATAAEKGIDAVPVKFVRDIARAGFGAARGRKDRTGRELMEPYTPYETAVQAVGLTPSRRAEEAEQRGKFINAEQDRNRERRGLIDSWVTATPEGKRDAVKAIQQYNQTVPANAKIKGADLESALKRRKTEREKATYDRGMRITKQNRDIYKRMNQVYGD